MPYFHLVFTIPDSLNSFAIDDARRLYSVLFSASSDSLLRLFRRVYGAVPAAVSVLHTWGSNLSLHPHIHCVVSGGGMSPDGRWVPAGGDFLLDVRELSAEFKKSFLRELRTAFPGREAPSEAAASDWVVFCRKPFADPGRFVEYIARYTHRAAISNGRIAGFDRDKGTVSVSYKDYKGSSPDEPPERRIMELPVMEFIRRFLMHVLPRGFRKIRTIGLFAGKKRSAKMSRCRALFGLASKVVTESEPDGKPRCPACGSTMERISEIPPDRTLRFITFRNELRRSVA